MDKKETGEYEKEKRTGSEAKKMGNERMGENEEVCPFENILFCPGTPTGLKSPVITGLFKDLSHSWQRNGNNTSLFNNKELTDFD